MIKNHVKQVFEPTPRWIRVMKNDVMVADSKQAMLMIESFADQDYYFPMADVRQDLLQTSDFTETSGFKGTKRYWHLEIDGNLIENAAWTYPDPLLEAPRLKGKLAFWPDKDKRIEIIVDGEPFKG